LTGTAQPQDIPLIRTIGLLADLESIPEEEAQILLAREIQHDPA